MILFVVLVFVVAIVGSAIGAILGMRFVEWLDEHGPKWWPGR